jgi:excisionase family DNA binding protein
MTDTSTKLLTREEAAKFLGLSRGTLEVWACTKRYPLPYVKVGRLVKYRLSDLQAFLDSRTVHQRDMNTQA